MLVNFEQNRMGQTTRILSFLTKIGFSKTIFDKALKQLFNAQLLICRLPSLVFQKLR